MQLPKIAEQFPVIAPLFHLVVCAVFLSGYAAGFGAGVGGLFGISDLFSLSLSDLAVVYVGGVLIPLYFIAPHFTLNFVPLGARLANSEDPADQARLNSMRTISKWLIRALFILLLILWVPTFFFAWRLDQRIPYLELSGIASLSITLGWLKYAEKLPTSYKADLLTALVLCLLFGAFIAGLGRGQGERRYDVAQFEGRRMKCGAMTVIRPVGARFLALDSSGKRYVINDECKVLLTIPARPSFEMLSLPELARRWWNLPAKPREDPTHPSSTAPKAG